MRPPTRSPMTTWEVKVAVSRLHHRLLYLVKAPVVYRNWWAVALPKLGIDTVLRLRDGSRYFVRAHTLDVAVVNEAAMLNPYLGSGYVQIPPDATVIDVGANIGDFSIQAARRCPGGRVIAIEPLRDLGVLIERQASLNGVTNITWVRAALAGDEGITNANRDGSQYFGARYHVSLRNRGRAVWSDYFHLPRRRPLSIAGRRRQNMGANDVRIRSRCCRRRIRD